MILENGLDLKQVAMNPFGFQDNYHYYEPEVFSMNRYFEGYNLRQLKRLMFIFNQTANAYMSYLHLMENRYRKNVKLSSLENEALTRFENLYDKVKKIVGFMNEFRQTSKDGLEVYEAKFGPFYTKKMHGRCWVKDDEVLRNVKYVRFKTEHGRNWRVGETEQYFETDSNLINGIESGLSTMFHFGYWLEYFRVSLLENLLSSETLNDFNPNIIADLCDDALKLRVQLTQLGYYE